MKPKPKQGCLGIAIVLSIGALIGYNCTGTPKKVPPAPAPVIPHIEVDPPKPQPKPEPPKPAPESKPDLSKVSTKALLKEFETWQHNHPRQAMEGRIYYVWCELTKRPEVKWEPAKKEKVFEQYEIDNFRRGRR